MENALKIEVLKFSDEGNSIEDMIEYEPAEFIQYEEEYIVEEEDFENPNIREAFNIKSSADTSIRKRDEFLCCNRECKKMNAGSFASQSLLDKHNLEMHLEEVINNQCPICNKAFNNLDKLCLHMQARHIPKQYICDNCGKVFKSKDNLRLHLSHHRKYFLVQCRACDKTYKSMQSLRYHLRQHFEHFKCEECGKIFEHKKLLIGHIVAKHSQELMVKCRFCTRMFSRNDVKEAHEREIHKNGEIGSHFKCKDCDEAFDFRVDLMKHRTLNHYSGSIFSCQECGKIFKKMSLLKIHMNCHLEKTIKCNECEMMFTFTTGLAKHKKLGRCKGKPSSFNKNSVSKEDLARIAKEQLLEITVNPYSRAFEEMKQANDPQNDFAAIEESKNDEIKVKKKPGRKKKVATDSMESVVEFSSYKFEGEVLKEEPEEKSVIEEVPREVIMSSSGRVIKPKLPTFYQFPAASTKLVNIHKKANLPFVCDQCGQIIMSKSHLMGHLKEHIKNTKYDCDKCGAKLNNMWTLKRHYSVVHPELNPFKDKKFKCDLCPKKYISEFLLSQHKLSHENLKSEKCPLCPFATNVSYDLKNHIKRIHNPTRDFKCTVEDCGKAFKRRCDMENHLKAVHSEVKVYVKCPTCGVIVLEKGLQSHMINRHSEKAKLKPFVCKICGKAERYEKNLQRHYEAVHEPRDRGIIYPCTDCNETFYRRRDLKSHSFVHFDGEIFSCPECENKYKSRKELTNHQYTHRCKEWPCEFCEAVFQTKSGRAKHVRKHAEVQDVKVYDEILEEIEID